jgi:hypothetical protein
MVGRIHDHLVQRYGANAVFMDVGDIPYGVDFREHIQLVFSDAKLLIVVIGHEWLGRNSDGRTRIHERADPVHLEVYTALNNKMLVLPVLIDGTKMPGPEVLPRNIKELAFRNALHVDSSEDFHIHVERLITAIDHMLGFESKSNSAVTLRDRLIHPTISPKENDQKSVDISSRNVRFFGLLPHFLMIVGMLLVAHYLIIMKLNLNPIYLRLTVITISGAYGFLLPRSRWVGIGATILVGLSAGIISVAGMTTIVGMIDGHSVLPSGTAEWQEAFEYIATITLSIVAGSAIAHSMFLNRSGLF